MKPKQGLKILFLLYLAAVVYVTLFAWNYGASLGPEGPGGRNYNLIPLRSIYRITIFSPTVMDPLRIIAGNVIMFIPFGFLLPSIYERMRKPLTIVAIGCCFSISIEISQFLFTQRVSDVDDLILNTLGTWVGASFFYVYFWVKRHIVIYRI
ncbi:VanZ family protein [bacterium LRH843]|nr:VanZ family protein [bacterium LRH843]